MEDYVSTLDRIHHEGFQQLLINKQNFLFFFFSHQTSLWTNKAAMSDKLIICECMHQLDVDRRIRLPNNEWPHDFSTPHTEDFWRENEPERKEG
jgi:hypothetical protein